MFSAVFIGLFGTFFEEANNSLVKHSSKKISLSTVGLLTSATATIIFAISIIYKYFSTELILSFSILSIPLLIVRLIAEIIQSYITIKALSICDRTTFATIRIVTIPLLFLVDIVLNYQFSIFSIIGIGIIISTFLIFQIKNQTLNPLGWKLTLFTACNAVFTISAFKYSIHYYLK